MDEEKETKQEPETPVETKNVRSEPETTPVIDNANTAAERMEAANKERKELLDREEAIMAKRRLGGTSEAGGQQAKKEPETDVEYAEKIMAGEANPLKDDGFI